jgi:hypothetical protein
MKNFTATVICLCLTLFLFAYRSFSAGFLAVATNGNSTAQSTYQYAQSSTKTSYFFTERDISTSLFAVPYTYCVQVIRDDGDWYYVKYAEDTGIYKALYGYCQKSDFSLLSQTPEVTYLYKAITVTYKTDATSPNLPVLNELTVEAAFYGTYYSGATAYSYVLCEGSFGYISGANDDYPLNITQTEEQNTNEETTQKSQINSQLVTAIILAALAATALILLFITTRRPRKQ